MQAGSEITGMDSLMDRTVQRTNNKFLPSVHCTVLFVRLPTSVIYFYSKNLCALLHSVVISFHVITNI